MENSPYTPGGTHVDEANMPGFRPSKTKLQVTQRVTANKKFFVRDSGGS